MERSKRGVSWREWLVFVFVGLAGQFAWSIENMYLNSYLYALAFAAPAGQGFDSSLMVALTTALSAVTATLTTIFMGSLTDKVRKRKIFIACGYLLWGIATACFGLVDVANADSIVPIAMSFTTAAIWVIVIDCIMTFFGSTANDSAFNAYVTKNVSDENRGKVEGVLSVLPLVAMLIIFVALNGLTASGQWDLFFYIIGGIVFVVGLVSFFLIPKEKEEKKAEGKYLPILADGFRPSTVRKNKALYLLLLAYFVYNVAVQVFFPYLMVYVERVIPIANLGSSFLTPFAIVMACALILGSVGSVFVGRGADRTQKRKWILPTTGILALGLLLMFFAPSIAPDTGRYAYTAVAGIVMILGYVSVQAILNALIRSYIPHGKEGSFMGVRMIFGVALPMCIGPFIGNALNASLGGTYVDSYGQETALPSKWGYLVAILILVLLLVPAYFYFVEDDKTRNRGFLLSKLVEEKEIPKPERSSRHPRPFFERKDFLLLDGPWELAIGKDGTVPSSYPLSVFVPYAVESPMSGVSHLLEPDEYLFYHRKVEIPDSWRRKDVELCFEGVDQVADVFVDGVLLASHVGGYTRFRVPLGTAKDSVDLVVRVRDATDSLSRMVGKQRLKTNGWFYSSSSGIWKPVYLERVGKEKIEKIDLRPDYDRKSVFVTVTARAKTCQVLLDEGDAVTIETGKTVEIPLPGCRFWSVEDPYLYHLQAATADDRVSTFFGVRKIESKVGEDGKPHLYLNGRKIFLNGLLDQGYYGFGGLTPEREDDYRRDIENAKRLGFNCLRMHVKVEGEPFYYEASKAGLLVIQDIPNGGSHIPLFNVAYPRLSLLFNRSAFLTFFGYGRRDKAERHRFEAETEAILESLSAVPAIVLVTLFNEGWGEFEPARLYDRFKEEYPQFLFDTASGWLDCERSDVFSVHTYTLPHRKRTRGHRPTIVSECGGTSLRVQDHFFYPTLFGHHVAKSPADLERRYGALYKGFYRQIASGDLNGLIYTQLNDCEREGNGLYTLDRKVLKIDEETIQSINKEMYRLFDIGK